MNTKQHNGILAVRTSFSKSFPALPKGKLLFMMLLDFEMLFPISIFSIFFL